MNQEGLTYQDVLLIPRFNPELESRSSANTIIPFLGKTFRIPVLPSNMASVIDVKLARFLASNGYFYIYHRFGTDNDEADEENTFLTPKAFVRLANVEEWAVISMSIGVDLKDYDLIEELGDYRIDYLTIDVAHAHHYLTRDMLDFIQPLKKKGTKIIAGNVTTSQAVEDLAQWGADCVKVGIGQGSICTTRFETGFSVPMFSAIQSCCTKGTYLKQVPIIADGGIKTRGDIAKALVAGANMVMAGHLFAACSDSAAKINKNGKKVYFGSASFEAKGHHNHVEGTSVECNVDVSFREQLYKIEESLQSAISYAGGKDLSAFNEVEWIRAYDN